MNNKEQQSTAGVLVKWLLSIVVVHLLAAIVYSMLLGGIVMDNLEDDKFMEAYTPIFYFGIVALVLFAIYYVAMLCRDIDFQNDIKAYMKEKDFTVLGYFKDRCLKMTIYRMIVFVVWHIPLVVMYLALSMAPVLLTFVGKLWVPEAGTIAVTGSVVLGVLINVSVLLSAYVISLLVGIRYLHKDIKENSFT